MTPLLYNLNAFRSHVRKLVASRWVSTRELTAMLWDLSEILIQMAEEQHAESHYMTPMDAEEFMKSLGGARKKVSEEAERKTDPKDPRRFGEYL